MKVTELRHWARIFRAGAKGAVEGRSPIAYLALADAFRAMARQADEIGDEVAPRRVTDESQ